MAQNFALPERVLQELKNHMAEEFCIENFNYSVKIGSMNGDSYSSNIYRIVVKDQTNDNCAQNGKYSEPIHALTHQFILKMAPTFEVRRQMFSTIQQFAAEHHMYKVVLPALRSFQLRYLDEKDIFQNYPKMISACLEPGKEYILFEDMSPKGYDNFYRPTPLGFAECTAILTALAQLHAVSFALRDQCPEEFTGLVEKLKEIVFPDPLTKELDDFLQLKIDCALTTLNDETDGEVKEKLLQLKEDIGDSMKKCVNEKTYSAILHGDCWISNILCKRKPDASVDSVVFVDWQITRNTTPIVDLSYLIFCSTDSKLRKNLPELLEIYYEALKDRIMALGSDPAKIYPRVSKTNVTMSKTKEISSYMHAQNQLLHAEGFSSRKIAVRLGCSRGVVRSTIRRFEQTGLHKHLTRSGRKRITTVQEDRLMVSASLRDREKTSAKLAAELSDEFGKNLSSRTVRRRLCEKGLGMNHNRR